MTRRAVVPMLATLAAFALTPSLQAQSNRDRDDGIRVSAQVSVGFTTAERQVIVDFFRANPYEAQPLPPGITKKLARGKPLPPGIARTRIPDGLRTRLQARPGVEVSIFGDRIVLLEASGLVVDILEGIFR